MQKHSWIMYALGGCVCLGLGAESLGSDGRPVARERVEVLRRAEGQAVLSGTIQEADPTRNGLAIWIEQVYHSGYRSRSEWRTEAAGSARVRFLTDEGEERDLRVSVPVHPDEGLVTIHQESESLRVCGVGLDEPLTLIVEGPNSDDYVAYRGTPAAVLNALSKAVESDVQSRRIRGWFFVALGAGFLVFGVMGWHRRRRSGPAPH